MATRRPVNPPSPQPGIEASSSPESKYERAVYQPSDTSWGSVAAIVAVILFVFWFTDRVERIIKEDIKPIDDKIVSLHEKFDKFEDTYAEDKLNHLKEFHINRSSADGDE